MKPFPFSWRGGAVRPGEYAYTQGAYLTDGRRLFHVVSAVSSERTLAIELEDCMTLERRLVTGRELATMGLRVVRDGATAPEGAPAAAL